MYRGTVAYKNRNKERNPLPSLGNNIIGIVSAVFRCLKGTREELFLFSKKERLIA